MFLELLIQAINIGLNKLGLPITPLSQFLFGGSVILLIVAIAYVLTDLLIWFGKNIMWAFSKPAELEKEEMGKGDGDPLKKIADLFYYEVLPPRPGQVNWDRTGRGIRGMCLSKRRESLQEMRELLLLIRFNGDWFFFKEPKSLVAYETKLFDKEAKRDQGREDLSFIWSSQPMTIKPEYRAEYEVEVEGHYPHLVQNEKRVFLLLAEFEEDEINEGIEDRFLLFEEIGLIGGIAWQGRKVHVWTGGPLSEEEIVEIEKKYLDAKSEEVLFNIDEMY